MDAILVKYALLHLFCTPVPNLPLLFQGVSASDLPTNQYLIFKLVKSEL